ncbi:MAG: hypothetical protein ACQCXQ_16165, partial [Verrucomicrobiales bacterium]
MTLVLDRPVLADQLLEPLGVGFMGGEVVALLHALLTLELLGGDAGFELGGEVSSLAFHWSGFGVIRPSQTSQSLNIPLAPVAGTLQLRVATSFPAARRGNKVPENMVTFHAIG